MATVRWSSSKSTLLALKNGATGLGAGADQHLPIGYATDTAGNTYKYRGAVQFNNLWTGVFKITSAVLSVKTTNTIHVAFGSDPDVYVEQINATWTANSSSGSADGGSGFSGNTSDYLDVTTISTGRATADITTTQDAWQTIDITAIVEAWAPTTVQKRDGSAGGNQTNYGVLIKPVVELDASETTEFYSHNATAANRPSILLTYDANATPAAPTNLSPSGTIASAFPVMSGTFSDPGDTMSRLEVQVSTDSTFTTVTHWNATSATFTYSAPSWTTSYAGTALTAGTYYWRARVYDSVGVSSAWSSTVTLTVTNPPSSSRPRFRAYPPRIELFDTSGTGRGPGTLRAIIDDAKNIGVSAYANESGEAFFTLPAKHPLVGEIVPLERHYRVSRYDPATSSYVTVGRGILEDYEASGDEVVAYGRDYLGLLETSISAASTTYTSTFLGTIVHSQLTQANAETNSRIAFTTISTGSGYIETTSTTSTMITAYEPRLSFIRSVANVSMSDRSVRTIFSISRDAPYTWKFWENAGFDELTNLRLEYGSLINDYIYAPDYRTFATHIAAIGIKREGASILFSTQSSANSATYGRITRPALFQDVVNQTALDRMTLRAARTAATSDKRVGIILRTLQLGPWDGWELGDSVRVVIGDERVALNGLYTIWGMEWKADPDGRESLFLNITTKLT